MVLRPMLPLGLAAGVALTAACGGGGGRAPGSEAVVRPPTPTEVVVVQLATPTAAAKPLTPSTWVDVVQRVPWVHLDSAREEYTEYAGPGHCGWEHVRFLSVEHGRTRYIRDAGGVLEDGYYRDQLKVLPEIPVDAVDTGYRDGTRELWLSADAAFAYIVDGSYVEQWPRERMAYLCQ